MEVPKTPSSPPPFQQVGRTAKRPYPLSVYIGRFLWGAVYWGLFRWSPPRAFGWRRMLLRCFKAKLTRTSALYRSVKVYHPWLLEIGEQTTVAKDVDFYNLGPISVGSHSVISQGAVLCAGTHDYTLPSLPLRRPPIRIGSGVWIAREAFIGPGVTVHDNAVVGARAVVMQDVPAAMVVAGNPARVVKKRLMREDTGDDTGQPPERAD
ncbi:MAG: wcaF [Phycisphaerales bacterium]|nr:wcaF [Phycisphaerales bacterium]